jgi:ectoine hydroxylase-related dioxygenase (phytanoyl-CoA dioxygenase family)
MAGDTMILDIVAVAEEIVIRGFAVAPGIVPADQLARWRDKIDKLYALQEDDFGRVALAAIEDADVCRAPLLDDFEFLDLATEMQIIAVMRYLLGDWLILNLQNAIISRPHLLHHQSHWHRDLMHQKFVSSRPLSVNALIAIDDFTAESGGTCVLPSSHKVEELPSQAYVEANQFVISAPAGSAILFDSMLFHRTGANRSTSPRRAVNHQYTLPFIKQQYDFPQALGERTDLDPFLQQLLGFTTAVPRDHRGWRNARAVRLSERARIG